MVTDEDIQRQWRNIRRLNLAQMKDGGYAFALTSESNTGVPNVDRFLRRGLMNEEKRQKERAYEHHHYIKTKSGDLVSLF